MRSNSSSGSSLLIIAGPGSGETEIIAWRVSNFFEAGETSPNKVLVTTFTNKAALELKDRIQKKVPLLNVDDMQVSPILLLENGASIHPSCKEARRDQNS